MLIAGLMIWLLVLLPGLAWIWIVPDLSVHSTHKLQRRLHFASLAVIMGSLFMGLTTLISGELGIFTHKTQWFVYAVGVGTGIAIGMWRNRELYYRKIMDALSVALLLLGAIIVILALPQRGEWIVGGWDPGVYAGQGVALARTGTFYPDDSFFYELLTDADREIFTRTLHGRTERFPAVVTHPEKQSLSFEFFKFTPAIFAATYRAGGISAMLRTNTIIALFIALVFFTLVTHAAGLPAASFGTLILCTQPIFLHHTHWPLTEPLQLLLIYGLLHTSTLHPRKPAYMLIATLCVVAAVLNRFSFLPFFGVYMICLSIGEAMHIPRTKVIPFHLMLIAGVTIAAWTNTIIAPTSLRGWDDTQLILIFASLTTITALVMDCLFSCKAMRQRLTALKPLHLYCAATIFLLGLVLTWIFREHIGRQADLTNLQQLLPFTGIAAMLLAAAGGIALLYSRKRPKSHIILPIYIFLLLLAWMMILRKSIFHLYPWATRRYFQTLLPWLSLSGGYLLAKLWLWKPAFWLPTGKIIAGLLTVVLLLELAPVSRRAWRYTSYNAAVNQIELLAAHFGPQDIVIADHFLWGTPLALIHGVNVLNGKQLWADKSGVFMTSVMPTLEHLNQEGWRILFLTNTPEGIARFPVQPENFRLLHTFPVFEYQRNIQHPRATRYALETRSSEFRIYQMIQP